MAAEQRGPSPPRKRPRVAFNPGLLASPFYRPPVYGGPACSPSPSRLPALYRRPRPRPAPAPAAPALGRTAQRLAELLAHCESPVAQLRRRERAGAPPPEPRAPLRAPQLATLLRLKQRNRCVASAQAAIAASLSSSAPYDPTDYSLPQPRGPAAAPALASAPGKLRPKLAAARHQRRRPEEDLPPPVRLPDITLHLADKPLPDIDLGLPKRPEPKPETALRYDSRFSSKKFIFREPLDAFEAIPEPKAESFTPKSIPFDSEKRKSPEKTAPVEKPIPNDAIVANLSKFLKKPTQWECDSCLSRNDNDKVKCVCCEAPKPGSSQKAEAKPLVQSAAPKISAAASSTTFNSTSGLSDFIKRQQNEWECSCCMTRNKPDRNKCACCEAAKPGTESVAESSSFNFGSAQNGTFKFGIDKAGPTVSEVDSGSSNVLPAAAPTVPGGFSFGIPSTTSAPSKPIELKFGMPNGNVSSAAKPPTDSKIVNGGSIEPKPAPTTTTPFTFGVKPTVEAASPPPKVPDDEKSSFSSPTLFKCDPVDFAPKSKNVSSFPSTRFEAAKEAAKFLPPPAADVAPRSFPFPILPFDSKSPPDPKFSFGAKEPVQNLTSENSFKTPTPTPFSFGSEVKADPAKPADPAMPAEPAPKTLFSLPTTIGAPLFPATSPISTIGRSEKLGSDNIKFPTPVVSSEKPKEPTAPTSLFSFKASPVPASNAETDLFKNANPTSPPVFAFGSSSMTKTEPAKSSVFGSSPPSGMFGAPVVNGIDKAPASSLFKNIPAASTFASNSGNIFGSKPSTTSPQPGANLFSNPQSGNGKAVAVFGSAPIAGAAPPAFSSNNMFMNQAAPMNSFNTGNIFGSAPTPSANATPPSNLFGVQPANKILNPNEQSMGMFGNKLPANIFNNSGSSIAQSAPASGVFGVSTPVFGAAIPFGEVTQTPQNPSFKFGESNNQTQTAIGGFGQAPVAGGAAPLFSFGASPAVAPPMSSQFNFSMGANSPLARPVPGGNSSVPVRRYKRAVRRNVPQ